MNYVERELRRQAEAFAALMSGGKRERDAEETKQGRGEAAAEVGGGGGLHARFTAGEAALGRGARGETEPGSRAPWRRGEDGLWQAAEAPGQTETAAAVSAWRGPMETERFGPWAGVFSGTRHGSGGAPALRETEGAFRVGVPGLAASAGTVLEVDGGLSAGELSQAVQRDARRYDGGYPLY